MRSLVPTSPSMETAPDLCPECGGKLIPYEPLMYRHKRFLVCEGPAAHRWWWDGPSILDAHDPCQKRKATGACLRLSDEEKGILART